MSVSYTGNQEYRFETLQQIHDSRMLYDIHGRMYLLWQLRVKLREHQR